jgi:pyruvate dehydrogenase E1 component
MIPFYIFYSMFGFQRTGDQIWQTGDALARGFLLGATAGRTTLNGEGLQHEDGHSHVMAAVYPHVVAYDVAYAYELAVVIEEGLRRMLQADENVVYYITLQNESYTMPPMPREAGVDVREGILRGLYRVAAAPEPLGQHVQLFGSGSILREVLRAQELLEHFGVSADVWSVTSYQQLYRDAIACERHNRLHPESDESERVPYVVRALSGVHGPFVAASDYVRINAEPLARFLPGRFVALGTDGFGMSDTRQSLRRHFEVDAEHIALAALDALRRDGELSVRDVAGAIAVLGLDVEKSEPLRI